MHKKLNITPWAATFTAMIVLVGVGGCGQTSTPGKQCDDKACFTEQFADCEAAHYTTEKQAGAQARYQVLGSSDSQCRVQVQYADHPKPAWVDKSLAFVLDSGQPFEPQMQKALQTCLTEDAPGSYECSGPLRGIASESGQAEGNKQGPDSTALMPGSAMAQLPAIADDAPTRFPVEIDGQWGYIDRDGELMIEPEFEAADDFHNGLAGVKIDGSFGYVNTDGKVVIKPRFDDVGAFAEGLAAVQLEEKGPLGFINRDGKMVISAQFPPGAVRPGNNVRQTYGPVDRARFNDGLAPIKTSDPDSKYSSYGFIDTQGQWKIKPQFRRARPFSEGLAAVEKKDRSWVYIDTTGKVVLDDHWFGARDFSHGLAAVDIKKSQGTHRWQYIDKQGKVAVAPDQTSPLPDKARAFSEGLGLVYFSGFQRWEYITPTKRGNEAEFTKAKDVRGYEKATPFRGGLARVIPVHLRDNGDRPIIYIDRQGNQIWPREEEK